MNIFWNSTSSFYYFFEKSFQKILLEFFREFQPQFFQDFFRDFSIKNFRNSCWHFPLRLASGIPSGIILEIRFGIPLRIQILKKSLRFLYE